MAIIRKRAALCVCACAVLQTAWAYNPPSGGERLPFLGHPGLIAGGSALAGGLFCDPFRQGGSSVGAYMAQLNPALMANNQRVSVDAGYAGLVSGRAEEGMAHYVSLGGLLPTRRGVFSARVQGNGGFLDGGPATGNAFLVTGGFARDITPDVYVGAALSGGVNANSGTHTALALYGALGVVYRLGPLGGLKDCAAAVTLDGLGRGFDNGGAGIDGGADVSAFPASVTPRAGFAALFYESAAAAAGFSASLSFPFVQNALLDIALHGRFGKSVLVSAGWPLDLRESLNGAPAHLPYIGVSYIFTANTGKAESFARRDWARSDVNVSGVWQGLYKGEVNLIGAGAVINLGSLSGDAPRIIIEE